MPRSDSPNYELLLAALREAAMNNQPGRTPSGIAMNAYLSDMPLTGEQQREKGILDVMDSRVNAKMMEEANFQLKDKNRRFDKRTGVRQIGATTPLAQSTAPVNTPFGAASEPTRTIQRFANTEKPVDPDAAMSERERAMLDPNVLREQEQSRGNIEVARIAGSGRGKPLNAMSSYAIDTAKHVVASVV
jgi:hypothetical protein